MRKAILFLFVLIYFKGICQDSIPYSNNFRLYEGLYLNYNEFRVNWPIPKEKIITKLNKDQLDFYSKLIEEDFIEYKERDGSIVKIASNKVWGYCQNNTLFINMNKTFYRVTIFGAICSFIGTVEVQNISQGYDPFMNPVIGSSQGKTKEIRPFLFHFYSGDIVPNSPENLEEFFKQDEAIYKEYIALKKKKKKEFSSKYIRLYNEKHPVYFPKE